MLDDWLPNAMQPISVDFLAPVEGKYGITVYVGSAERSVPYYVFEEVH
jgi:hypothetical protein